MTTIKLGFRPSKEDGSWGTVCFLLTHQRRVRTVNTDYHLLAENWNEKRRTFVPLGNEQQQDELRLLAAKVSWEVKRISDIIVRRESIRIEYGIDELMDEIRSLPPVQTFFSFVRQQIDNLNQRRRAGTATAYGNMLRSFMLFRNGCDLTFDMLTPDLICQYEQWLRLRGVRANSSSCYMRTLRAIYRKAVQATLTPDKAPFRNVFTGYAHTVKRALTAGQMRQIVNLNLPTDSAEAFARDLFLFSLCTRGMSFVDMAFLRKSNLSCSCLTYSRQKTGQTLSIAWEPCMQEIVERYAHITKNSVYLLPIITRNDGTERRQYLSAIRECNRALKRVGYLAHLPLPLTTYVARHTWASLAQEMNIPISVIRDGMGHENLRTTQIYLASINSNVVDKANQRIIGKIL